ncbi:FG-GAP-like repeat-containing protein [Acidicapsa dinghuensis]|uniref:FG-GAP-like repeat-containing protein n=1 Tax=Acidicapsa dinghuensis TaxID=2218256 RepID=A0ABW1EJH9_9BACT|nr:FG-GAP-like repeat-containing protein [Acidicapsa dinghuensis]
MISPTVYEFRRVFVRVAGLVMGTVSLFSVCAWGAPQHFSPEAVKLNNRGVAQMGQQFTDRAATSFAEAFKADPTMAQAEVNEGVALFYLQKLDESKAALEKALKLDPQNPRGWYNLGLVQHAGNDLDGCVQSFQHVIAIDARDADSYYFEGVCYQEQKDFDKAIAAFGKALEINPLHASAEFATARALQRSGHVKDAAPHFDRFKHLTTTKIASALSLSYGEQGHYSTSETIEEPQSVAAAEKPGHFEAQSLLPQDAGTGLTGGACLLDVTGSGAMDLVLMSSGANAIEVLHRGEDGKYSELSAQGTGLAVKGRGVACAVGDYDSDGLNDLAVAMEEGVALFRNLGKGKFENATSAAGLTAKNHPTGITFVDFDHDGDLDLFVTGSALSAGGESNVLWRNNGNKTFAEWTEPTGLGGSGKSEAVLLTDFNNDRAVDLAVTGDGAAPVLYVNPREGKYPTQPLYDEAGLAKTTGIASLDFNKDGWMDLVVTHDGAPGLSLWRNVEGPQHVGRRFERVKLPGDDALRAWGVTPIDIDNDGWVDLAAIVETASGYQVRVLRSRGDGTFDDVTHAMGADALKLTKPRGLIAADVDGDGLADLIVTQEGAAPVVLLNRGTTKNHSVRIDLKGFADNKTAIGSKVEVFAGNHWQKFEVDGSVGYGTQGTPQVLAGIGDADGVDLVRILWPTGVLQDEIDLPRKQVIAITEADRRGSSCPVLFVWNGERYVMVTDVIGAGVVGHWFTPTRRNIPRPGEWIKVDGKQTRAVKGKLSFRFIEPMEEVNYIDQLRVVAVDHPEGVEVNPDERFLDDPPFASGRVVASAGTRLPVGAWDGDGRDVLDAVSKRDHSFASGFTATPYDGFANLHALTIDLGEVSSAKPLRLLMTGYVNYFSASSLYGAWQAGIKPISPYVEAEMPDGTWRKIKDDAGFPAGLERVITVDLTGKVPAGVRRIRLMSNLEIYWDQVLIDDHAPGEFHTAEVPMSAATLHFHGYPKQLDGKSPGDLDYDYNQVSLTGPFQRERGSYTRMGNVMPLVTGVDNRYVIFGSGEEIAAEFDTGKLPALPSGWKRDYFFYANGYVKDMDWWDASPFTVAQLPFHGMSKYPYPKSESFPNDAKSVEYQLNWNDRYESGDPVRSYRFDFHEAFETPQQDGAVELMKP